MTQLAMYRIIHFIGVFAMVTALAAALARAAASGGASGAVSGEVAPSPDPWKKRLGIAHGSALVLVLLGGFGALARLGLGLPGWAMAKLGIWVVAGGLITLRESPSAAAWGLALLPLLAALAGWLAYVKPF